MGASVGAMENVRDIRDNQSAETSTEDAYSSLPTISDLEIADRIELIYHLRSTYQQKIREITNRNPGEPRTTNPPVRESDVDDLLYAQIELESLVEDMRNLQGDGPLSVADLSKGVEHMFSKYDTDGSGQIDADEFYKLMQDCNGAMDGKYGCTREDVQVFMDGLDKDGDGLLDLDEFVAFIVSNLSMAPEERRDFRERSPLHGQLSDMMITMTDKISDSLGKGGDGAQLGKSMYNDLPDKMERRIQYVVERLYKKYDDDNSNSIDADEFLTLMKDVMKGDVDTGNSIERIPTKEDALKFIKVIASTRMANVENEIELQKNDFLTFTLKVLTSTSKQRISFGARSRMHHKLLSFFLVLITDSLDIVESDLDRLEFDKKEKRAEVVALNIQRKEEEQALQKAKEQKIVIDKKIKAAEAANKIIKERAEQEKKDAVANAAAAKQQAQIAAAAKTAELMEEKSEGTPRQPETTDDYSNHSSPKQNTAQATAKQQETLLNRLDMYTSFVWDKYDVDKDGSLDATEFETFLRVITQRGDAITSEDCQRFLRQMDRSGDGKLQRDELVAFAGSGFEMGEKEAKEYASRSVMHQLLVVFVNKLREAILYDADFEKQVKAAKLVENVWAKYDTDDSGSLDAEEVRLLITEVMEWDGQLGDEVTIEEATRFIGFLDTDGDGSVDQTEFLAFICNAMDMTVDLRVQFAQRSPMHAKIMVFCTNLTEKTFEM